MLVRTFHSGTQALAPFEAGTRRIIIEWSPDHVHILLWNLEKHAVEAVESYRGTMDHEYFFERMVGDSQLMALRSTECHFFSTGPRMMPVPAPLYDAERCNRELNLLLGHAIGQSTQADLVLDRGMVIAWQMPELALSMFRDHFEVFVCRHIAGNWMQHYLAGSSAIGQLIFSENSVLVHLDHKSALVFAGALPLSGHEDLVYRLLHLCQRFGVAPEEVWWRASGSVSENSEYLVQLERHLTDWRLWTDQQVRFPAGTETHIYAHLVQTAL